MEEKCKKSGKGAFAVFIDGKLCTVVAKKCVFLFAKNYVFGIGGKAIEVSFY
ncbi:MAG: hypothetical protein ACOCYO_11315 [Bacteroidota bacterium]